MGERTCTVDGCTKNATARTRLCAMHYQRRRNHGSFDLPPRRQQRTLDCRGDSCDATIDPSRNKSGLCRRCYRRKWYADHGEHERANMAKWAADNPDENRRRQATYYAANSDRLRQAAAANYHNNRDAALAAAAEYRDRNRDAIRRRGAERRKSDPTWPLRNRENARRRHRGPDGRVDYVALLAEHGMTCHICGDDIATMADLHFDHVIPLARGGTHTYENIRPAHAACNLRKGARIA